MEESWDFVKLLLVVYITSVDAENVKQGHNICNRKKQVEKNGLKIDRVDKPNTKWRMVEIWQDEFQTETRL